MAVTSSRKPLRSLCGSAAQNGLANVSSQPRIPVGSGVGRGIQLYTMCHNPGAPQPYFVVVDGREVPWNPRSRVSDAAALKRGYQGDGNCADAGMAAHLAHKPPSRPEGAECTCDWRVWIILNPVQDGIRKDGIEFALKGQRSRVHDRCVKC